MKEIRNFVIIAHIDHGKSTLADRFLELSGTVPREKMKPQYLDMMELEREKGVTIKMAPVRMEYTLHNKPYILNLIDTPGHIDFNYEVSRALAAVEGAILLVDATKGVQAQTIYNLGLAKKQNLAVIPAINKIDRDDARVKETVEEMSRLFNFQEKDILKVSAKEGINCQKLLEKVTEKVPSPKLESEKPLRALIFDLKYDPFKGIIAFCRLFDGKVETGQKIFLLATKTEGVAKEVGFFVPDFSPQPELRAGEIGYIATGIKEIGMIRVGDTITIFGSETEPLAGYEESKSFVFASLFPEKTGDFEIFKNSLEKLKLTDPAISSSEEEREILGRGFSCGFLGSFHAEIVLERIKREFGLSLIITPPSVVFKILDENNREILISKPENWPERLKIEKTLEPWAKLEIITPLSFCGKILEILSVKRAINIQQMFFGEDKLLITSEIPLMEIISGFYDKILESSQGFASMNYEVARFKEGDLIKLDILIAGERFSGLSKIVPREKAFEEGKTLVRKLKELLPPQLFAVPIQAAIDGKVIARETLKARRRDVLAPLYGGDYTRKRKLLQRQKKGKEKLKERGQISFPADVFLKIFKNI